MGVAGEAGDCDVCVRGFGDMVAVDADAMVASIEEDA